MELTEEQSVVMDYLGEQSNQLTKTGKIEKWKENVVANREFFSKENPPLVGTVVYIVGAGPSLEKNVQHLKSVSERGIILAVDASLRFLLKHGIRPEYCMCIDGSEKMWKMVEGCDTEGITLVCTPSSSPDLIKNWKGPRFFVSTPHFFADKEFSTFHLTRIVKASHDIKEGDMLFVEKDYKVEFGGVTASVLCGGNVSTAAHHFAVHMLRAQQVVFCGMDFSWTHESHHYAGHEHEENARARTSSLGGMHKDVNGEGVNTNFSLLAFKRWHEAMARQFPKAVTNATEGGILGVDQEGKLVDYMEFLTLEEAVKKYTPKR